jgi:phosphoribosylglycinamide formyltransferase-1
VSSFKRLAILGSGAGTTAEAVVFATADISAEVTLIIGNNSKSGIFDVAARHRIRSLHLSGVTHPDPDTRDAVMLDALDGAEVDLIVLAGYMKKIGPLVRDVYERRIINTHPALLPAYGSTGMYGDRVHEAVLRDKATVTGATIHIVTENYDEGPILAQSAVEVLPSDSVASLRERVQIAEKALLTEWIRTWAASEDRLSLRR